MYLQTIFESKSKQELLKNAKDYGEWGLAADWYRNKEWIIPLIGFSIYYASVYCYSKSDSYKSYVQQIKQSETATLILNCTDEIPDLPSQNNL
jgi:hypothetical protein